MNKKFLITSSIIAGASIIGAGAFGLVLLVNKKNNESAIKVNSNANASDLPTTIKQLKKQLPEYYGSLQENLRGEELFNSLNLIQQKHISDIGSYSDLYNTYRTSFRDKYDEKDNTLYDIYSEKVGSEDDFEFRVPEQEIHGNYKNAGDGYNREHLIPQSVFGKSTPHIHNDAHFVFPTDAKINGIRSDLVHDVVANPILSGSVAGGNFWKKGKGNNAHADAFEPDDNFKGDIARAYFYFQLTYHNYTQHPYGRFKTNGYPPFSGAFPYFKTNFLKEYLLWSEADPVDSFDIDVNNNVAKAQGGIRNPFDDMPELINLIWK